MSISQESEWLGMRQFERDRLKAVNRVRHGKRSQTEAARKG
jgi:hypothetical protein